MTQIQVKERVLTQRSVQVEAQKRTGDRGSEREHVRVRDVIEFGKALEKAGAPPNLSIRVILLGGPERLLRQMRVDWSEDLLNGEPAPEAKKEEQ